MDCIYNIKEIKGLLEDIILGDSLGIDGGGEEFLKVNRAAAINVDPRNDFIDVAPISFESEALSKNIYSYLQLLLCNGPVSVLV